MVDHIVSTTAMIIVAAVVIHLLLEINHDMLEREAEEAEKDEEFINTLRSSSKLRPR